MSSNLPVLSRSISARFLIVALIPLIGITAILTFYHIKVRQTDALADLRNSGNNTAIYFAATADFPLYSGNVEALTDLATSIANLNHVAGAMFLDHQHRPMASSTLFPRPPIPYEALTVDHPYSANHLYFKHPVYLTGVQISDYEDPLSAMMGSSSATPIGWVVLAMNMQAIRDKNRSILITSVSLSLLVILFALLLIYLLGLTILRPVKHLTRTVRQLEKGDFSARAPIDTRDELSVLAKGINRLAQTVQDNQSTLERRIKESTIELENSLSHLQTKNQQLEIAHEQAEMANQAKSQFLARMSHELRTPITAIQGFILLLTEVAQGESERHYCNIINQASSQLLTLIDDVLVFSKLQSNTVMLELADMNLAECVENVAALFSNTAQDKSLRLVVDIESDLKLYRIGDSARIAQVVNNLVSNAVKFTASGGVYIQLQANPEQPEDGVILTVTDTGIGIAEENREQIFQAFAQADTSISRQYGGTGLGLSIVKSLINQMGGAIELDSESNHGTSIKIKLTLPCQREEPLFPAINYRIALYSDSPEESQAAVNALNRFGCTISTTNDLDLLDTSQCDAAILCVSAQSIAEHSLPERILDLRQKTAVKFIILTPVFSISELFTQKETRALQPVSFLASPPALQNLYQALTKGANQLSPSPRREVLEPLQNLNILIAEDNDFTGLLLETLVGKAGGQCTLVTNGNEVIKMSNQEKYDVILMDLHMPELNGIDATKAIRNNCTKNSETPIIALTADIVQDEEDALLSAGANDMLFKPINENYLIERIRYVLGVTEAVRTPVEITQDDVSTDTFYAEVTKLLGNMRQALNEDDNAALRENAHQLIGIAGVFQLHSLDEKACELHSAIKDDQLADVERLLTELEENAAELTQPD